MPATIPHGRHGGRPRAISIDAVLSIGLRAFHERPTMPALSAERAAEAGLYSGEEIMFNRLGHRVGIAGLLLLSCLRISGSVQAQLPCQPAPFGAAATTALPTGGDFPWDIAVADFNSDTRLDAVTANLGDGSATVLLQNPNGTFTMPILTLDTQDIVNGRAGAVATGDLDNDGDVDVVTVCGESSLSAQTTRSLVSCLGNGAGGFPDTSITTFHNSADSADHADAVLGHIDHDGNLDLAFALGGMAGIAMGNGQGGWESPIQYGQWSAYGVALGDFNTDGHLDLATTANSNEVEVRFGDGGGGFTLPTTAMQLFLGEGLLAADVNIDAHMDLVARAASTICIAGGYGDGLFFSLQPLTGCQSVDPASPGTRDLAVGDFTCDGLPDIVTISWTPTSAIRIWANCPGQFEQISIHATGNQLAAVAVGDFNGDLRDDVITADYASSTVSLFLNQSAAISPWSNLGSALAGSRGFPVLSGAGLNVSGSSATLSLTNALEDTNATLVYGFSVRNNPFKGGTMVPLVYGQFVPFWTGWGGSKVFKYTVPGPTVAVYFQYWISDPAGPAGFSASNGLRSCQNGLPNCPN